MTIVPGAAKAPPAEAFIVGVGDRAGAEEFLAKIAPAGAEPTAEQQGELALDVYADGLRRRLRRGPARLRQRGRGQGACSTRRPARLPPSRTPPEGDRDDELPEARFAEVYLSPAGVQRLLAGRAGPATQLETFVDYGATSGLAAAAIAKEEGLEVDLVSRLDPKLAEKSPSFFSALPDFEPSLASARPASARSATSGSASSARRSPSSWTRPGPTAQGLAGVAPGPRRATSSRRPRVNPLQDLLPALGGQAALVAEPTDGDRPFASLIVDDVDEDKATRGAREAADAAARGARRRRAAARSRGSRRARSTGSPCARSRSSADGEPLLRGLRRQARDQHRPGGDRAGTLGRRDGLADSGAYERATDHLPDEVSALVFLNLDELFGQIEADRSGRGSRLRRT